MISCVLDSYKFKKHSFMANTVVIMSEEAVETTRKLNPSTTDNSYYLKKIQELANEKLAFWREKELREQEAEEEAANKSNPMSVKSVRVRTPVVKKLSKRQRPASVAKDGRKKRKVTKKAVRRPVVTNEVTERLKEFIVNEMKGTDVRLVIQKPLYTSDTRKVLNRLNMPLNQLETDEFLTADEKRILRKDTKEGEIEVRLLGPTLEMYKDPMNLRLWHMASTDNYVLTTNWYRFRSKNKLFLKRHSSVQVWSFRGSDQKLFFAVVCVEEPEGEVDDSDS